MKRLVKLKETGEIVDDCDNPWRECWCENCGVPTEYECVKVKE